MLKPTGHTQLKFTHRTKADYFKKDFFLLKNPLLKRCILAWCLKESKVGTKQTLNEKLYHYSFHVKQPSPCLRILLFFPVGSRCNQHRFTRGIWSLHWRRRKGPSTPWRPWSNSSSARLATARQKECRTALAFPTLSGLSHSCSKATSESSQSRAIRSYTSSLGRGTCQHGIHSVQSLYWATQRTGVQKQAHQPLEPNIWLLVFREASCQKQFTGRKRGNGERRFRSRRELYFGAQHCDWKAAKLLPSSRTIFTDSHC